MKKTMKQLLFLVFMGCLTLGSYAQQRTITGTVMNDQGTGLSGVSYVIKGTTVGGVTDESGGFKASVNNNSVLVFTAVGYKEQQINVGTQTELNIIMQKAETQLQEVVVTALGIKRAKASLGYTVQEVSGSAIVDAHETNTANALTGKVSGLQVVKSSNGAGGSSKLVLRGYNSLQGDNQPLIVVDGIPMENFTGSDNNDFFNSVPLMDVRLAWPINSGTLQQNVCSLVHGKPISCWLKEP